MSKTLTSTLLQGYRHPRKSFRYQLENATEERLLVYVFIACLINFTSRIPAIVQSGGPQLAAKIGAAFVGSVFFAPLLIYALSALAHFVLSRVGGRGSYFGGRVATIWACLLSAPLVLIAAILSQIPALSGLMPFLLTVLFIAFWSIGLSEAESIPAARISLPLLALLAAFVALIVLQQGGV